MREVGRQGIVLTLGVCCVAWDAELLVLFKFYFYLFDYLFMYLFILQACVVEFTEVRV
jgi:hypothetical protein